MNASEDRPELALGRLSIRSQAVTPTLKRYVDGGAANALPARMFGWLGTFL